MLRCAILLLALVAPPGAFANSAGAAPTVSASEQRIPFKPGDADGTSIAFRVIGGLAFVALLGIGVVYLVKRYMPIGYGAAQGGATHLRVVEIRRLTPRVTLFLIELDGVRLLLGQAGEHVTRIYEDPKPTASLRHGDG